PRTSSDSKTEKLVDEIAADNARGFVSSKKERERHDAGMAVLNALRQDDSGPLEKALDSGLLDRAEAKTLIHQSQRSPLYDRMLGFTYEQAKRVYEQATPEEQDEMLPLVMGKYKREMKRGEYAEPPETPAAQ
ncbi:MAG: hypothetical protein WAM47_18125, partial [Candidatus Sulfotelmatobacter sp.]